MRFTLFIAKRYLLAKKSHNVINIISIISASGIAIGTAALIIILSVYNGFEGLIKSMYASYEPDLLITPVEGKSFSPNTAEFNLLRDNPSILSFCEIVQENVFVKYGNKESVAIMKGVDPLFEERSAIKNYIKEGEFSLRLGEIPQAVMGRSLAFELGLRVHFLDPLELYFPSRHRTISMVNPMASLNREKLFPGGLFNIDQSFDKKYIFVPIDIARSLLEYDDEVTSIELFTAPKSDIQKLKREVTMLLGKEYSVKDRFEQNETLYKMMRSEKLSIYIILLFVVVIISCNLFGSLSMLIIEKREDSITLKAMGAKEATIKRIFCVEGWLISLVGIAIGTIIALIICFLQSHFGIISMPGNFIVESYPIVVKLSDIFYTITGIATIGLLLSLFPLFMIKNIENF